MHTSTVLTNKMILFTELSGNKVSKCSYSFFAWTIGLPISKVGQFFTGNGHRPSISSRNDSPSRNTSRYWILRSSVTVTRQSPNISTFLPWPWFPRKLPLKFPQCRQLKITLGGPQITLRTSHGKPSGNESRKRSWDSSKDKAPTARE